MTLDDFLSTHHAEVVDVQKSQRPGLRHLNLQDSTGNRWLAVLSDSPEAAEIAEHEGRTLDRFQEFRSDLCKTAPRVVTRIRYRGMRSLVLTDHRAVPIVEKAVFAEYAFSWLAALWNATASVERPTGLGSVWLDRRADSEQPPGCKSVDETLLESAERLVGSAIVQTIGHGCLCREHLLLTDSGTVWVHDWSAASESSEPWFDLADAVLSLLGDSAPAVLSETRRSTQPSRYLLREGLKCLAIDGRYGRDLLLLRLADRACSPTSTAVQSDWVLQHLADHQTRGTS